MAGDPKAYIDDIVIEGIISMGTRGSNEELARWRWFVDLPRSEQRAWVRRAQPWLQGDGTR